MPDILFRDDERPVPIEQRLRWGLCSMGTGRTPTCHGLRLTFLLAVSDIGLSSALATAPADAVMEADVVGGTTGGMAMGAGDGGSRSALAEQTRVQDFGPPRDQGEHECFGPPRDQDFGAIMSAFLNLNLNYAGVGTIPKSEQYEQAFPGSGTSLQNTHHQSVPAFMFGSPLQNTHHQSVPAFMSVQPGATTTGKNSTAQDHPASSATTPANPHDPLHGAAGATNTLVAVPHPDGEKSGTIVVPARFLGSSPATTPAYAARGNEPLKTRNDFYPGIICRDCSRFDWSGAGCRTNQRHARGQGGGKGVGKGSSRAGDSCVSLARALARGRGKGQGGGPPATAGKGPGGPPTMGGSCWGPCGTLCYHGGRAAGEDCSPGRGRRTDTPPWIRERSRSPRIWSGHGAASSSEEEDNLKPSPVITRSSSSFPGEAPAPQRSAQDFLGSTVPVRTNGIATSGSSIFASRVPAAPSGAVPAVPSGTTGQDDTEMGRETLPAPVVLGGFLEATSGVPPAMVVGAGGGAASTTYYDHVYCGAGEGGGGAPYPSFPCFQGGSS